VLIIDEAHHATAASYRAIINAYPDAVLIGFTATPCRGDGRGLGGIFEVLVEGPQVAELIKQEKLVPTRCYAPTTPDLRGVRMKAGDWNESEGSAPECGNAECLPALRSWAISGKRSISALSRRL
jgi:DNA repair protein RadD